MPKTIKEFKFGRMTGQGRYGEYLDGQIWVFSADELEEYPKGAETVRSGITSAASRAGLKVRSQIGQDGSLTIQTLLEEEDQQQLE